MASIQIERIIEAPAETVWDALRDVGALHSRTAPGFVVGTQLQEGARIVTFHNGVVSREVIVDIDDARLRVAYGITGGPFTHHSASNQVVAEGPGKCRFIWITDLLPDELAPRVTAMMTQGADAVKATMEAAGQANRA
jgi:hypothetical protein